MKADELISVVVPVYNVEKYLRKCIDSIINQTYENLEIIIVNDGSKDNSGQICDEYGEKYSDFIKVHHQINKGLSAARNKGLSLAKGAYITFIDSDDWIANDMIENMYCNIKTYKAQISGIMFYQAFEDGRLIKNSNKRKIQVMTSEEALGKFLFNENLTPCVCGKLYDIRLWENISCPEGKLFEDQYTTYKLIDAAQTIVFDPKPQYYYFKREGSIGHSNFCKQTYDLLYGIREEYEEIIKKYPSNKFNMAVARITWEVVFANMMIRSGIIETDVIGEIQKFAKNHMNCVFFSKEINIVRKAQIVLFTYFFSIYKKMYFRYNNKK